MGQVEFIHISDWNLINLEFQSKAQMTALSFHWLRQQHHLIFCQILIEVEGNQREAESRERMGFDAALSRAVGTHSWMEIEKIIVVPSGRLMDLIWAGMHSEGVGYCK